MNNYTSENDRVSIAVYGLMLLIVINIGRIQELIPYADKLKLGKVAFIISVLLYLITLKDTKQSLLQNVQVKYVVGIMLIAVISVPMSIWPGGSIDYITSSLLKTFIFFLLLIKVVSTVLEAEKLVWAVVFSTFSLSVAALLGSATGRMSASSTYDPNDLAFVMVSLLPLIFYYALKKTGIVKLALSFVMILMVIAILATVSRGGFVGLLVITCAILRKQGTRLKNIVVPLILMLIVFKMFAPATYWDRISTMANPSEDYNVSGQSGRIEIWQRGLVMMISNPITGVGISCFSEGEGRLHGENTGKWMSAHNSFVQLGAEIGLVGLFLFIKLLISSIMCLRKYRVLDVSTLPNWLFDGTEVAIYGYITAGFFLSQAYSPVIYLLVGLVVISSKLVNSYMTMNSSDNVLLGRTP